MTVKYYNFFMIINPENNILLSIVLRGNQTITVNVSIKAF